MKTCPKCQQELPESAFSKNRTSASGFQTHCKACSKVRFRAWYAAHPEQMKKKGAAWRAAHPDQVKKAASAWRAAHPDSDKKAAAAWRAAHPDQVKKVSAAWRAAHPGYYRDRCLINPQFKLAKRLRVRLYLALKGGYKAGSAVRDLGCTIPELRRHLETQFKPGMTWGTWGPRGWHVDHIKPLAAFDLTDHEQFLRAVNFSNLQPLWASENIRKGARTQETLCRE